MLKQILNLQGAQTLGKEQLKSIQGGGVVKNRCDILPENSPCRIGGQNGCCRNGQCVAGGVFACIG